ncbi:MAG: ABC transporter ATP-binding protein [Pseudomonadales bacterium]|nr:ABC transporter ATP-binding protein [Pseudomonadales bacterium]
MASERPVLQVQEISRTQPVVVEGGHAFLRALTRRPASGDGVVILRKLSFSVARGEIVGILGVNGAGKSTLLQCIAGLTSVSSGQILVDGRVCGLLELGSGFDYEASATKNIWLNGLLLGLSPQEIVERTAAILAFADLQVSETQPLSTFSTGMVMRLAFAIAVHAKPDLLLIDEALAVGDEAFQSRCFERLRDLAARGTAILFVTHASSLVQEMCDRAILLDCGELLAIGSPKRIVADYQKLLFSSGPERETQRARLRMQADSNRETPGMTEAGTTIEDIAFSESTDLSKTAENHQVIRLGIHDVQILKAVLLDQSGCEVNVLRAGESYRFRYSIRFGHAYRAVRFGMLFKSVTGVELGGSQTGSQRLDVSPDDIIDVTFCFNCRLNPGTWFLNAGVLGSAETDEEIWLERFTDLLQFRVVSGHTSATGMVDFGVDFSLTRIPHARSDTRNCHH